jgi:hypothetical protein
MGFELRQGEEREPRPGYHGGEGCPFIEGEMKVHAVPEGGGTRLREVGVLAGELEIGSDLGIAWGELLGEAKVENGLTDLVRTEEGIAEVEVEGRGADPLFEECAVRFDGLRVKLLFIQKIGFGECRVSHWIRGGFQRKPKQSEEEKAGEAA